MVHWTGADAEAETTAAATVAAVVAAAVVVAVVEGEREEVEVRRRKGARGESRSTCESTDAQTLTVKHEFTSESCSLLLALQSCTVELGDGRAGSDSSIAGCLMPLNIQRYTT